MPTSEVAVLSFFRYPDVRASDAEREATVAFLGRHCAEGRLSAAELSERVGRAYGAVHLSELQGVTRDLPRYAAVPRPVSLLRRGLGRRLSGALTIAMLAALVLELAHRLPAEAWGPVVFLLLLLLPLAWMTALALMPFALPLLAIALNGAEPDVCRSARGGGPNASVVVV